MAKQDEEDMTMDEILASIRRYVTEDQYTTRESHTSKQQPFIPSEPSPFEETVLRQSQPAPSLTDYEAPYDNATRHHDHHHRDAAPQKTPPYEQEVSLKFDASPMSKEAEGHHHSHHHHPHHELERGVTSEGAISAAAMALSKLAEVKAKTEEQAFEAMGTLTLDTLIANLARPMIKEWLDQNLPKIVESMVAREIERIRLYSSK